MIVERGVSRKVEANLALKNTTTGVMMTAEQSPRDETAPKDRQQGIGPTGSVRSISTTCGTPSKRATQARPGFDLATKLEEEWGS